MIPRGLCLLLGLLVVVPAALAQAPAPWYRTKVPPIAPERWTQPAPPIPEPTPITREDYLNYIKEKWSTSRASALQNMGKPDVRQQWKSARSEAFFYKITGDEQYARNAMGFIRGDYRYRTEGPGTDFATNHAACPEIIPSLTAYHWIRESPSLTPDDHALVRTWIELKIDNYAYYECGAMNRGIGGSACVMICNYLYPDAADKPLTMARPLPWVEGKNLTRRSYVEHTWPHWWDFRDFYENSSGYEAHGLEMILAAWEITGQSDLNKDPGMRRLAERYLAEVTPNGAIPGYGDACGFNTNPYTYIFFFETWATAFRDGRFKWAAHRLFDFFRRHEQDYAQWGNPIYDAMDSLMEAYLVADESVEPVEPGIPSTITYRKDLRWLDQRATGRHAELLDRDIPGKLLLRTGWNVDDAYAMVELCKPMGHGHASTASLECYLSENSVLLAAPPYLLRAHPYHNCMVAWPRTHPPNPQWSSEVLYGGRCEVTVPVFHHTRQAAYAHIHVTDYMNGPTTLDRQVFFLGKRGLWLRDTLTAAQPFSGTIGPAFQFVGVYPNRGENWVNACQTSVPVSFIWTAEYMMQFTNRPLDLLVYYLHRPEAKLVVDDVTFDNSGFQYENPPHNNFTDRVWYQKEVEWTEGERETFDSILIPHSPVADAAPLAAGISSLLDEREDRAVLQIQLSPDQTAYVGINSEGRELQAGPLQTDARYFVAFVGPEGALDYWAVEGTRFEIGDVSATSAGERGTLAGGSFALEALRG